jgi:hypothetical protein
MSPETPLNARRFQTQVMQLRLPSLPGGRHWVELENSDFAPVRWTLLGRTGQTDVCSGRQRTKHTVCVNSQIPHDFPLSLRKQADGARNTKDAGRRDAGL